MPAPTKKSPVKVANRPKRGAVTKSPLKAQTKSSVSALTAAAPTRSVSTPIPATAPTLSVKPRARGLAAEERRCLIAEAAYLRAERSGFRSDPMQDWLDAEGEVDALLLRRDSDKE